MDTETFADYSGAGLHAGGGAAAVAAQHFSPPTVTKTWFHQGAVGDEFGSWEELDYTAEYWPGDLQLLAHADGVNQFLASFPQSPETRRAKRDALRSLRGRILRSELYATDGSAREVVNFRVTP